MDPRYLRTTGEVIKDLISFWFITVSASQMTVVVLLIFSEKDYIIKLI